MTFPKNQHIISKTVLKNFSKKREKIIEEIEKLENRYLIHSKYNSNSFANDCCYKILKKDFDESDCFLIRSENILKPDNKKFCSRHLYSINFNNYIEYLKKFKINTIKNANEIRYSLEKDFGNLEDSFGNFMKFWNNEDVIFKNFEEHLSNVSKFVQSNELRAKNIYLNTIEYYNYKELDNLVDYYKIFDKNIYFNFLELYSEEILNKSDSYELVEFINYTNFFKNSDLFKKLIAKLNNNSNNDKNIMLLKNSSNIAFLISDVAAQTFYDNFEGFNDIIEILGIENFTKKPNKITIMPIKYNLLAIVTDVPLKITSYNNDNNEIVKKINSIISSNINEWLIIYDAIKTKNEIIDINFYNKIKNYKRQGNLLHWYEKSVFNESISNLKYGYKKIDEKDFILINNIIVHLKSVNLNLKNLSLNALYTFNSILNVININNKNFIFYFKDEYYTLFKNLEEKQLNCLKLLFLKEDLCNEFTIDDINKIVIFYK